MTPGRLLWFITACLLASPVPGLAGEYEQASNYALRQLGKPVAFPGLVKPTTALLKTTLPKSVAVRKVVPRQFSDRLLTGLFARTGIDSRQTFDGATGGVFGTRGVRYYGSLEKNHTLTIIPAQGWTHYTCQEAVDAKGDTNAIGPSEEETLKRGLEFAKFLGLNDSDLATLPGTNRLDYRFAVTHGSSKNRPRHVVAREVFFRSAIEGYPVVTGHLYGGLWVGFGYGGKLYKFALAARATEPTTTLPVTPLAEQIRLLSQWKTAFATAWPTQAGKAQISKDAVLEVDLVEVVYFEDAPEKSQRIIPPLLRWEADLKTATETNAVVFFTPIREAQTRSK